MEDNIAVAIRIRPLLEPEVNEGLPIYWKIDGERILQIEQEGGQIPQSFAFDHAFDTQSNNEIFQAVVQPMINSSMNGYNATVFAYGQTASGKTHTMLGHDEDKGIIPLTIENIFEIINSDLERKFLLRLSYIEIYNNSIIDLLDDTPKTIKIFEDPSGNIHLNVIEKIIQTSKDAHIIIEEGDKRRKYGITAMNQRSSRSHTIFRIIIESTALNEELDSDLPVQVSHVNLVDLAGSERVSQTKATGARLREGGHINKSLHLLSLVIRKLSEGTDFTSFRVSKLTRILKESLGGNAKTLIIGTITPTSLEDSQSTLSFTSQAKRIKNKPVVNQVLSSEALTKQYIQKEKVLRKELAEMADDKRELEEKHAQTVADLTDKLQQLTQKFILSNNKTVSHEEKRRHTMCASSIPLKMETGQCNKLLLGVDDSVKRPRRPLRRSIDSEPNASNETEEFVYPQTSSFIAVENYETDEVEVLYKRLQNLIITINPQDQENRTNALAEGIETLYNSFCTLQNKLRRLESQTVTSNPSTNGRCEVEEFLNAGNKSPAPTYDEQEACISTSRNINPAELVQESPCFSKLQEEENLVSEINQIQNDSNTSEQVIHSLSSVEPKVSKHGIIEEVELLQMPINKLRENIKITQEENLNLKLELQSTITTLENTEDRLLSLCEDLDCEENKRSKREKYIETLQIENEHLKKTLNDFGNSNNSLEESLKIENLSIDVDTVQDNFSLTEYECGQSSLTIQNAIIAECADFTSSSLNQLFDLLNELKMLLSSNSTNSPPTEEDIDAIPKDISLVKLECDETETVKGLQSDVCEETNELSSMHLEDILNNSLNASADLEEDHHTAKSTSKITDVVMMHKLFKKTTARLQNQIEELEQLVLSQCKVITEKDALLDLQDKKVIKDIDDMKLQIRELCHSNENLINARDEEVDINKLLTDEIDQQELEREQLTTRINLLLKEVAQQEEENKHLASTISSLQCDVTREQHNNFQLKVDNQILQTDIKIYTQTLEKERKMFEGFKTGQICAMNEVKETVEMLQSRITKLSEERLVLQEQKQVNDELIEENKTLKERMVVLQELQSAKVKWLEEKFTLLDKLRKQTDVIAVLNKQGNALQEKITEHSSQIWHLIRRHRTECEEQNIVANLLGMRLNSVGFKPDWNSYMKQLDDVISLKDQTIGNLDKEIIGAVCRIRDLEKLVYNLSQPISKLKDQYSVSRIEVKKRRSLVQDLSRNLNEDEDDVIYLCPSCKVTNSSELNHAFERELRRKTMEIAKLEIERRKLHLDFSEKSYDNKELQEDVIVYKQEIQKHRTTIICLEKQLDTLKASYDKCESTNTNTVQDSASFTEQYKQLRLKYKHMKELALWRRRELKKYQKPKIDCASQTDAC